MKFDYSIFDSRAARQLKDIAAMARHRAVDAANSICQLGKLLNEARELIGEQTKVPPTSKNAWGEFCRGELGVEPATARRFIHVYEAFGESVNGSFVWAALERLSYAFVPEEAREEAVARAAAGETITTPVAREIIRRHRTPRASHPRDGRPPAQAAAVRAQLLNGETLHQVRSAVRRAFRECRPADRSELRDELVRVVDVLYRECSGTNQPTSEPDSDEIDRRAAEIRRSWSPDDERRRREGTAAVNPKKKHKRAKQTV